MQWPAAVEAAQLTNSRYSSRDIGALHCPLTIVCVCFDSACCAG